MEARRLEWGEAEVAEGRLTVPLAGEPDSAWTEEFGWVAERLAGGNSAGWGEIEASKKKVTVARVVPGAESDLRHFLESVVQQVNADQAKSPDDDAEQDAEDDGPDRQMTEAFRAFADDGEQGAD